MLTITERAKQTRLEKTFFAVHKRQDAEGKWGLFTEPGYKITGVSEGYKLITNKNIVEPFLNKFGINAFQNIVTTGNGKTVTYVIETGKTFEVTPGDELKQRLYVINSYDKTKAFKFVLGAFRSFCANGLYNGVALMNVRRIHYGEYDIDTPIQEVLSAYQDLSQYDHWRKMATINITEDQSTEFIKSFKPYDADDTQYFTRTALRNRDIQRIAENYTRISYAPKENSTVWGLYNRVNWSIARAFRTRDQREYIRLNGRLENELMKHFSIN